MTPPETFNVELELPTKYELDAFQKHAVLGIHAGDDVFVTAKTGSGKTFVGEYLCARALKEGKRVFYTTPIKSLSNQKYHDLKKLFPSASIGILTGDIKMCPDADIVVMTAEILRNLFYKRGTATEGVGLTAAVSLDGVVGVVMDEVHYIQDADRGHVWEETLIHCPPEIQLVLLSATMPSAAALATWIADTRQRRVHLLSTTFRVVPLVHGVLEPDSESGWRVRPLLDAAGRWISDGYTGWLQGKKGIADAAADHRRSVLSASAGSRGGAGNYWNRGEHDRAREATADALRASKVRVESPIARLQRTVTWLESTGQLPALFFVFSRRDCERYAACLAGSMLDSSDAAAATHIIDFHLSRYRSMLETSPQYHKIRDLLCRGIAFHHSGLQPLLKEIVEILFARGFVKVLFATETFSVGLNMPTKTVVFLELEKFSDNGRRPLRPDEYIQMAGRAGRRGLDTSGLVLYEPLRDPVDTGTLRGMLTGGLPPLESRMRFGYDFVMRMRLAGSTGSTLVEKSYWAVQQRASRAALGAELVALEKTVATAESLMPAAQEALLEAKVALEIEIATTVNSKRKKATAALAAWNMENADSIPKGAEQRYTALREARKARDRLAAEVADWDAAPLLSVANQERKLKDWGFLNEAGDLTEMGQVATEVNEGHHILMPWLACSRRMDEVPADEIPCVLAAMIREGSEEEAPSYLDAGLSTKANDAIYSIMEFARSVDTGFEPTGFWRLSQLWISVAARWMAGEGISTIAMETGLMEGNVLRGLLKISNLLDEWAAAATLRRDLATLEKLAGLSFLRDEIVIDSIYLRL